MIFHPVAPLTPREHCVMARVICGDNDSQIAHMIGLAPQTITHYVHSVCQKLGAANRSAAAVQYDLRYGPCVAQTDQPPVAKPLSPQECRVIELVAEGISEPKIAEHLGVTLSTVKQHLLSVRRKLAAPNRIAAAVEYYRQVRALSYMKKTGSGEAR